MKETSREWLSKAKDDLDVIDEIKNKKHLTNMVAFHAQQAIEKSLKAIIDEFDLGFVKIRLSKGVNFRLTFRPSERKTHRRRCKNIF